MATAARTTAAQYDTVVPNPSIGPSERVASIDVVRGIVMVLMAIDHVRVYSGLPAGGPTPGIFFTRWITHFVAPAFVFLAGTSAFLHGRRLGNRAALSRFLVVRGLWLILLELTVIRIAWTFNFDFSHYLLAGVIWMIGWSMIVLAAAVHLPTPAIGGIGVGIIALHNITDFFQASLWQRFGENGPHWLLKILYFGGAVPLGSSEGAPPLLILYVLIPWIGVMMAGYAFGTVMLLPAGRRRQLCLRLGAALIAAFVVVRGLDVYGDPRPWRRVPAQQIPANAPSAAAPTASAPPPAAVQTVMRFLNTTKYPASLAFLLMTLGPMFVLLGLAEGWRGRIARTLSVFGRVPLFYYLLHIPLIHLAACVVSLLREGQINPWLFANHPLAPPKAPPGYAWSLGLLYLVWALCVIALYFPSRQFARLRAAKRSPWLSYL